MHPLEYAHSFKGDSSMKKISLVLGLAIAHIYRYRFIRKVLRV